MPFQHFTHFAKQAGWRKRFLDKGHTRLNHAVMKNGVVRVTRGIEHTDVGTPLEQPLRQLSPAHGGHYDVGQEEVNAFVMVLFNL